MSYSEKDIVQLTDKEHVRLRTHVYLGSTKTSTYTVPIFNNNTFSIKNVSFVPAVFKAVNEVIDNSIDEFSQIKQSNKTLTLKYDSKKQLFTIADNGRGIPVGTHASGRPTPEVVFNNLRSGRNFKSDKDVGVIGQNGMGVSLTNICSSIFNVCIHRDNQIYTQSYQMGGDIIGKPHIKKTQSVKTGTEVEFKLDPSVFENINIPTEMIESRAVEVAFNNPNMVVELGVDGKPSQKLKYTKGLEDLVKKISKSYYKFEDPNMEFFVIFDVYEGAEEQIFTWVNSSLLFEGGLCNTQFLNAFFDNVLTTLAPKAKKEKCTIDKNDIRHNLLILGVLKVKDPEYDSQAKTRLTGPNLRNEIKTLIENSWSNFTRKNKEWLETVFEHAISKSDKKATKKAAAEMDKMSKQKIPGLLDATGKNRQLCKILITEGKSASSKICEVRNPQSVASFPLTGKINNVWGEKASALAEMGKITGLLAAVGLVPGRKADRDFLRYGQIVFSTDADFDGNDIFTLLCNLFYKFWPELFDPKQPPIIYRLVAPNVVVSKGNNRIHFSNIEEFKKNEKKYSTGWTVEYMKGLGSMTTIDWDTILNKSTDCFIPIQDVDGSMKTTLELLFGPDPEKRKEWLSNE